MADAFSSTAPLGTAPGLAGSLTPSVPTPTGNQPAQPTAPGAFMPTAVAPMTPTKLVPPPAVVTPAAAQENNAKIQSDVAGIKAGVQAQQAAKDLATQTATQTKTTPAAPAPDKTLSDISSQIKDALSPTGTSAPQYIVAGNSATSADGLTKGEFVTNQNTGLVNFFSSGTVLPFDYIQKTAVTLPSGLPGYKDEKGNFYSKDGTPYTSDSVNSGNPQTDHDKNLAQVNSESTVAHQDMQTKVDSINNGTFPLNAWQQSLVNSIQQQLQQNLALQKVANANYEGGIKVALYRSGEIQSPEIAQGEIMASVSAGIAKIADLEAKASQSIAQLEEGFMKDDYDMVMKSYDATQTYLKNKADEIEKIYTDTQTATNNLRDYNLKLLTTQLESDKFTWQQKQDLITNAQKDQALSETQRKDLADEAYKAQTLAIQQGIQTMLGGAMATPVTNMPNGSPDPVSQQKFLQSFSPDMQTLIKGIADYTINPNAIPTRQFKGAAGLTQQQILSVVKQYDPSFDQKQYNARQSYVTSFTSGKLNTQRTNLNTAINHIGELKTAADALEPIMARGRGGIFGIGTKSYNNIAQLLEENAGDPLVTNYKTIVDKLGTEIAGAYGESTGGERSAQQVILDINNSPAQKDGVIGTTLNLLSGLTTSMAQDYKSNMGKAPESNSIVFPSTQNTLNGLRQKGININISNFIPSPYSGTSDADLANSMLADNSPANKDNATILQGALQLMSSINQSNAADTTTTATQ